MSTTVNLGPGLVVELWVLATLAIIIVSLRIVAKLRLHKFERDDVVMIFALISVVVGSAMSTASVHYGLGRSITAINPENLPSAIMYNYLSGGPGLAGSLLARIAFTLYLINLLGAKKIHRTVLWTLLVIQLVINFITILFIYIQCPGHPSAIWDPSTKAYCWSPVVQLDLGYFSSSVNIVTDLYLSAFPAYIFWNMNLLLRLKISLTILLGLGLFATVASFRKTIEVHIISTTNTDPTIQAIDLVRWTYVEANLIIITSSIPCIRSLASVPCIRSFVKGITAKPSNSHALCLIYNGARKEAKPWPIRPIDNDTASEDGILQNNNEIRAGSEAGIVKKVDISVITDTS